MTATGPTARGLVSEAEGTQPKLSNGGHAAEQQQPQPQPPRRRRTSLSTRLDGDGQDAGILLPDGRRVPRPSFPAQPDMYKRVPAHLMKPDGTPNYMLMSLTSNVYSILPEGTPLTPAVSLSQRLGNTLLLKREDMTPVFSFKLRGAYNLMRQLSDEERWRGVIACSAGNHAQGVAMSGRELGIACTIVMPLNTPSIKYQNVDRLGARVVLHGADFDEAQRECSRLAQVHGLTIIPPFNDPYVIAGQGTAAVEVLRQTDVSKLDAVFIPVGGGGFLAGMAAYIKAVAPPRVKVIGVETYDADALAQTLGAGQHLTLSEVGLFADGTAVRRMGDETLRVCAQLVDEIVLVSNDELCAAIKDVFQDTRAVPEPSGALGVAGAKKWVQQNNLLGKRLNLVSVVSGANINFSRLRFIAERAEVGEGKEVMLRVVIPEKPGAFLALHSVIHPRAVTEFVYRYSSSKRAYIYLSFYLASSSSRANPNPNSTTNGGGTSTPIPSPHELRTQELSEIFAALKRGGMQALDISDNELAKSHSRYLVGGGARNSGTSSHSAVTVVKERVFRFEFPERPNALRKFLETLPSGFNISLFHYRNQGGDVGKVLCGLQIPEGESSARFDGWLHGLAYPYCEETQRWAEFMGEDDDDDDDDESEGLGEATGRP